MQQVIQPINGLEMEVVEIPAPICQPGQVLIANHYSLISAGTERSTIHLAKKSLLQKARQRPDHVRRVLEKISQEGLFATIRQVRAKLDQPMPLGYSSAGVILEVGADVTDYRVGERVASNGCHAGVVAVPKHLVARVPATVPLDQACYAVVGAIALQGVRLAGVGLGDVVAVIGLGLIGQLTVALLKATGAIVIGTDLDERKRRLALRMGADAVGSGSEFADLIANRTNQRGADRVLITASTRSNEPMELAARSARQKARLVAVGDVGMTVPRREFYPKELEFIVSCSYGPGRYDTNYEELGQDYPAAYVRWTEQRNLQAVLDQMAANRLDVTPLTTHCYSIESAAEAYEMIESNTEPAVGVLLQYPAVHRCPANGATADPNSQVPQAAPGNGSAVPSVSDLVDAATIKRRVELPARTPKEQPQPTPDGKLFGLSILGAGNFTAATLLPTFAKQAGFRFRGLISATGLSSRTLGRKYGFQFASTEDESAFQDPESAAVVVATRHHLHTELSLRALRAGKHVFLEKPLAINEDQYEEWLDYLNECRLNSANRLNRIRNAKTEMETGIVPVTNGAVLETSGADAMPSSPATVDPIWTIGFNRRFAPPTVLLKELLRKTSGPKNITIRMNAGAVPADHWTQHPEIGGGRLIGEACHAVDLAIALIGAPVLRVSAETAFQPQAGPQLDDSVVLTLRHLDGSIANILYTALGDRAFGKERVEVFAGGISALIDDFRQVTAYRNGRRVLHRSWWSQQKGYQEEVRAFLGALQTGQPPIPYAELLNSAATCLRAVQSLRLEMPLEVQIETIESSQSL